LRVKVPPPARPAPDFVSFLSLLSVMLSLQ
jgi:hypothetical protein